VLFLRFSDAANRLDFCSSSIALADVSSAAAMAKQRKLVTYPYIQRSHDNPDFSQTSITGMWLLLMQIKRKDQKPNLLNPLPFI